MHFYVVLLCTKELIKKTLSDVLVMQPRFISFIFDDASDHFDRTELVEFLSEKCIYTFYMRSMAYETNSNVFVNVHFISHFI